VVHKALEHELDWRLDMEFLGDVSLADGALLSAYCARWYFTVR